MAKIRSGHEGAEADVTPLSQNRFHLRFREAQRAIAPGQAVVLYEGEMLLGGGFIAESVTEGTTATLQARDADCLTAPETRC
jgi:tRNA-specific 2-thiouridylase